MPYGPQINKKQFGYAANISLIWMYFLLKGATFLFPSQVKASWIERQGESARLIKSYIIGTSSSLREEIKQIDKFLENHKQ